MTKYLRLTTIFILFLFLISCKHTITQKDYPDADAVFIKLNKEFTLNDDGTMNYHYSHELKLFSYLSFNSRYGETFITYNPKFQKLKVNKAITVNDKGAEIHSPNNAFNEVLPQFAANAPAYNYLREMIITHTGLERNATINLDYEISTQKDFLPALMGNEIINNSSPVRDYDFTVKVPKGKKLFYKLLNSDVKPDSSVKDNCTTYTWKFKEVPAQPVESMQPASNMHLIRLLFSSSGNISSLIENIVKQDAFKYELNEEIRKEVNGERKANSEEGRGNRKNTLNTENIQLKTALLLQKKVVEEFNYYPIPASITGFKCKDAVNIWKSNGGTELEKAVLLKSLLMNAKINSEILAVSYPYYSAKDKINQLFDNFIIKAKLSNNDVIYLSPTHTNDLNQIYDLQRYLFYALDKSSVLSSLPNENFTNSAEVKGTMKMSNDNILTGDINLQLKDRFNTFYKYMLNQEAYNSTFNNIKEGKLKSSDELVSVIDLTIENKKAYTKEKNFVFFNIPEINNGISTWGLNFLPEKRNTPFELPSSINEDYNYSIQLPAGFQLLSGKADINIKNNAGALILKIQQIGNTLTVKKEIRINNKIIETKDYNDFKSLMNVWNNRKYRELVFSCKS